MDKLLKFFAKHLWLFLFLFNIFYSFLISYIFNILTGIDYFLLLGVTLFSSLITTKLMEDKIKETQEEIKDYINKN